jgi:cytidylate kinase
MNIITIGREFGSGGRELGKLIAEILGYDYYDKEIISLISEKKQDKTLIQEALSTPIPAPMQSLHHTFNSPLYFAPHNTEFFVNQRKVIEEIAKKGKDFVIIGRNADVILREYKPFNIFVTAQMQDKITRCMNRANETEKLNEKQTRKKINKIDKARKRARYLITERDWGHKNSYHVIVNTTGWNLKDLAPSVAQMIKDYFTSTSNE